VLGGGCNGGGMPHGTNMRARYVVQPGAGLGGMPNGTTSDGGWGAYAS
jgi:hypothetical protein